jgi:hypothetical protein
VSLLIRVALTLRIYTILLSAFSILHGNQLGYVTLLTVLLVILGALAASLREEEPQRGSLEAQEQLPRARTLTLE